MSDSSEDEDLSRFKEAVDTSFVKLIEESRGQSKVSEKKLISERYIDEATHYNDIRVADELQNKIAAKISEIIKMNTEFVDVQDVKHKKSKMKGGVKLFSNSEGFLSCEELKDEYTKTHNVESKKLKCNVKRRHVDEEINGTIESDKVQSVVVSGEYVLSKEETKYWKSRRKEKLFKYKSDGKSKYLSAVE